MKILAIDASGLVAGVAVMEDEKMTAEYTVNYKKTHSQTLMPMVDEVVRMTGLNLNELDAIAVSSGPGSFTGLRIGASSAKGLAMALGKPVVPVPTLEALGFNLYGFKGYVVPIMDARRSQVYTAIFEFDDGNDMKTVMDGTAMGIDDLLGKLEGCSKQVCFLGDGVAAFRDHIREHASFDHCFAPNHLLHQRAGAVGAMAIKYINEGKLVPAEDMRPEYFRKSQAEREREERLNADNDRQAEPGGCG